MANLRSRVSELEAELRQVRSLQRMTSSVLVRGMNSGSISGIGMGRSSGRGSRSRPGSHSGNSLVNKAAAISTRSGSPPLAVTLEGVSVEEDIDACSPMTPTRPAEDELDEPLMVSGDAGQEGGLGLGIAQHTHKSRGCSRADWQQLRCSCSTAAAS